MHPPQKSFKRTFRTYLTATILPITIIAFLFINLFCNQLEEETKKLNYEIVNQNISTVDTIVMSLPSLSVQVSKNENVLDLITRIKSDREVSSFTLWNIKQNLNKIAVNSPIENIGIYSPKIDTFIDKSKINNFNEFFQSRFDETQISADDFRTLLNNAKSKACFIKCFDKENNRDAILYMYPLDITKKHTGFVFYAILNSNHLLEKVRAAGTDESKSFAVLNTENNIILKTDNFDLEIESKYFSKDYQEISQSNDTVLYIKSNQTPLKYVYVYYDHSLNGNVNTFSVIFTLLLLGAVLASMLLTKLSTHKVFAKLLDENEHLHTNMNKNIEEIQKQKLLNYIYNVKTNNEFEHITSRYGTGFNSSSFSILCVAPLINNSEAIKYNENIINEISRIIKNSNIEFSKISTNDCFIFILGCEKDKLKNITAEIENNFIRSNPDFTAIGIGDAVDDIEKLWKSYDEAMQALRYALAIVDEKIIFYSDVKSFESNKIYYTKEKEASLIQNIRTGAVDKVNELLNELYQINFTERHLKSSALFRFISRLALTVHDVSEEIFSSQAELDKYERITNNILNNKNPDEAFAIIRETCIALSKEVKKDTSTTDFTEKAVEFIKSNYMLYDLSLDKLADHMNMNYYYTSRLFKEAIGCNFAAYLTAIRMQKAKELLESTDLSVKQIASKVGFYESNSFIRAFKKYYHATPGNLTKSDS